MPQQTVREHQRLRIQDLSERSGTSVRNIQKYIGIGLLRPPIGKTRTAYYVQAHLDELLDIRYLMAKERSLSRVAELMSEKRRKAAEDEARQSALVEPEERLKTVNAMNIVEDMLLVLSRNLPLSDRVHQSLIRDLRKAFDRARLETTESIRHVPAVSLPAYRIQPMDASATATA